MSSSPCLASHWIASFLPDTQPSHFIVALFSNRSLFELDFSLVHRIFFFSANLGKGLDGWSWSTFVIHHFHFSNNTPFLPPPPPQKKTKKKKIFTHFATVVISRKNKKTKVMQSFGWQTRCIMGDVRMVRGQIRVNCGIMKLKIEVRVSHVTFTCLVLARLLHESLNLSKIVIDIH